jgi:pseudouridine synthase
MIVRINKFLADAAIASRRKCDDLINKGIVTINGLVATNGQKVDTTKDKVFVSGREVTPAEEFEYLVLNKPVGYITASSDDHGRKTVIDLLPQELKKKRVYPVGRLDYDSRGLILLTNNGQLTHRIIHPKHHIEKEYIVTVSGNIDLKVVEGLSRGVDIGDYETKKAGVSQIEKNKLKFILKEGKHRQIRRMCAVMGLLVTDLQRVRIGNILLGSLKEGSFRKLEKKEIENLQELIGLI